MRSSGKTGRVSGVGGSLAATLAVRRHAWFPRACSDAPVGLGDGSSGCHGRIGVGRRPIRPERTEAWGDTIRFRDTHAVSAWSGMRKSGRDAAGWLRLPPGEDVLASAKGASVEAGRPEGVMVCRWRLRGGFSRAGLRFHQARLNGN